ncbi:MAG: hypothetical protein FDZ70_10045, partial [Actinobacteria bacterium]
RLPVVSWSDTTIAVRIPTGAATGYLGIVRGSWATSNGMWVGVRSAPRVTGISTSTARPGDRLTIYGSGFGTAQGAGFAAVCGVRAEVVSWSDTAVTVVVPAVTSAGYVGIYQGGVSSNGAYFVPLAP